MCTNQKCIVLFDTNYAFKLFPQEIDHFVLVFSVGRFLLDCGEGIRDNGEENAHQSNVDHHDKREEEDRSKELVRAAHRLEIKCAKREGERGLSRLHKSVVTTHVFSKEQVGGEDEGQEVEKEGDGEDFEVLGGQLDGLPEHVHLLVELKQLQELDRRQENHTGRHVAIQFIVHRQRLEVDKLR